MRNNVYSDTFWYGDMFLPVWAKNDMKNCEGMTSSTRSFEYS